MEKTLKIAYYKGGNWEINKKGFIICDCGNRHYNSPLSKERHIISKNHLEYLARDPNDTSEIKFDERSIFWDKKHKNWKASFSKYDMKYHKTFKNLEDAIEYRDYHNYVEENIVIKKIKLDEKEELKLLEQEFERQIK